MEGADNSLKTSENKSLKTIKNIYIFLEILFIYKKKWSNTVCFMAKLLKDRSAQVKLFAIPPGPHMAVSKSSSKLPHLPSCPSCPGLTCLAVEAWFALQKLQCSKELIYILLMWKKCTIQYWLIALTTNYYIHTLDCYNKYGYIYKI